MHQLLKFSASRSPLLHRELKVRVMPELPYQLTQAAPLTQHVLHWRTEEELAEQMPACKLTDLQMTWLAANVERLMLKIIL